MKIVLDTNVILAALFFKKGASNKLLVYLFNHQDKISVLSNTLVTEYEDVLLRNKNRLHYSHLQKEDILGFIDDLCLISHHQKINFLWRPFLKDYKDDMVLETAFNAKAEYIVTYNTKDFTNVFQNFGIKIITPKEFLELAGELK